MMTLLIHILRDNKIFFILFAIWVLSGFIIALNIPADKIFFFINHHHNDFLDKLMTVFSGFGRGDTIPIVLLSLLLLPEFRHRLYVLTSLLFGLLIPVSIYFLKKMFGCPRPLVEFGMQKVHTVPWLENLYNNSFPSGHTIGAFGFFLILSIWLPKTQKAWSVLFIFLALACAYSRPYLGQHFFKDIYVGSIVGVGLVLMLYLILHFIFGPEKQDPVN